MAEFYVAKTGFQIYDWSRAYGLALVAQALGGDVTMQDRGPYVQIFGKEPDFSRSERIQSYLGDDLPWTEPLVTLQRRAEPKARAARDCLSDPEFLRHVLDDHRNPQLPNTVGEETLYHAMEPGAAKGFREAVAGRSYTEGSQLRVPGSEWHLSLLGHANVSVWCFGRSERLCVLPVIREFRVRHLKPVQEALRAARRINGAGAEVTVAEKSCELYARILESQNDDFRGHARFDSMLFFTLSKTANQWKPEGLAAYPLALVNRLAGGDRSAAIDALRVWARALQRGNRRGWEALALALARAIGHPTRETWQRYASIHLRYAKRRAFHVYYEEATVAEVLRWVET